MSEFQTPWNPVESTTVEELLSHDPAGAIRATHYSDLIAATQCNYFSATASERWDQILPRILENLSDRALFTDALGGHMLVDCGAGKESWMRSFAAQFGTPLLLEVDIAYRRDTTSDMEGPDMRIFYKQEDMLLTLARLPSACANISINGIDGALIANQEYHKSLAHEIERVLQPGGIAFGFQSDVRRYIEASSSLISLRLNAVTSASVDYFVYKKQMNS